VNGLDSEAAMRIPATPPPAADNALLDRLARVLHEMGLPCGCQEEVERTLAAFAEFEARRARRRLIVAARERARLLRGYVACLPDLGAEASANLAPEEIAELADMFRVIAAAAAEGAANLEMLANSPCETSP